MHDLLLTRRKLDRESLLGYAAELGLDLPRFQRELDGHLHRPRVEADVALAQSLDLYQTPTFIINGRLLVGNRPIENFRALLDELLSAGQP